jgi:hypothetical protein
VASEDGKFCQRWNSSDIGVCVGGACLHHNSHFCKGFQDGLIGCTYAPDPCARACIAANG